MTNDLLLKNGDQRAAFGCVTTWKNANGETLTVYRPGPPAAALRDLIVQLDAYDPTFRLLCYSTPETIYRDLSKADTRRSPSARSVSGGNAAAANGRRGGTSDDPRDP